MDWQALRFAYAASHNGDVESDGLNQDRAAMRAAVAAFDWAKAAANAEAIIGQAYVDGEAHMAAWLAYSHLDRKAEAEREALVGNGLFRSIQSGEGATTTTAFTVICVREEYQLMNILGRRITQQALRREGGHAYDILETQDKLGDKRTYYFLIDRALADEMARFSLK